MKRKKGNFSLKLENMIVVDDFISKKMSKTFVIRNMPIPGCE